MSQQPGIPEELAGLVYVTDHEAGIVRVRDGDEFRYLLDNGKQASERDMERIRKLAIPPAWTQVWICRKANGHLQATGRDARGRKQYRYHIEWQQSRNQSKYDDLLAFGKVLPKLRKQIRKDLAQRSLTETKVIATVLSVMENTAIRIGNGEYEKSNRSYGLTTLKDRHVKINGSRMVFSFSGKKGIAHTITLSDRRLARIVGQCRDIPGQELFQFLDENGQRKSIDSGKVNSYIKNIAGPSFSSKDLRTWVGTVQALELLHSAGKGESAADKKRKILETLDEVSAKLGNTRNVCKKYYVHPLIFELYENDQLDMLSAKAAKPSGELTATEKRLMHLLKQLKQPAEKQKKGIL